MQAVTNLQAQVHGQGFDSCRTYSYNLWNETLTQIEIPMNETVSPYFEAQLTKFYTALYHAHMAPTNYLEVH